ncbi:DUF924 family protein [Enterococcus plantarum]|nr:DUF924 family protein [Enterococcus plantarum]
MRKYLHSELRNVNLNIVVRFERYPHRTKILGKQSTTVVFLKIKDLHFKNSSDSSIIHKIVNKRLE